MSDFGHPGQYLPHRPPMLMLSGILGRQEQSIHCTSIIDPLNPLLAGGRFPAIGGLELIAQAAGVLLGLQTGGNSARPGVIVQVKCFTVEQADIRAGSELHIHTRLQAGGADAALVEGEVLFADRQFFSGVVMLALLPDGGA
jgi:predicted hotdog family 3-hydroxylacyl-ACP dehydratase